MVRKLPPVAGQLADFGQNGQPAAEEGEEAAVAPAPQRLAGQDGKVEGQGAEQVVERLVALDAPHVDEARLRRLGDARVGMIHRPIDPAEQQEYYSGKKKCHTLKNLLVITETCHVCFLSHTYEGKASDKSLAELSGYTLPPGSCLYQDKGFQGFCLEDVTIVQPQRPPPGGDLLCGH